MIFSTMAKRSKRQVSLQCFKKWQSFYDKEYQTLSWLKCDVDQDDKTSVHLLWCAVCRQFEDYIRSTICICLFSDSLPFLIVTVTVACM